MQDSTWREKLKASGTHCFFSPLLPSRWTATRPVQFFILNQSGERRSLNRRAGQGRPYPKTDRKGDTLGAINLGQRGYRRVGDAHLQGARKRQADHDRGARQHADRDQSAFAVASHDKRAHPLVERRAPPTKGESTRPPGWAQGARQLPDACELAARAHQLELGRSLP